MCTCLCEHIGKRGWCVRCKTFWKAFLIRSNYSSMRLQTGTVPSPALPQTLFTLQLSYFENTLFNSLSLSMSNFFLNHPSSFAQSSLIYFLFFYFSLIIDVDRFMYTVIEPVQNSSQEGPFSSFRFSVVVTAMVTDLLHFPNEQFYRCSKRTLRATCWMLKCILASASPGASVLICEDVCIDDAFL